MNRIVFVDAGFGYPIHRMLSVRLEEQGFNVISARPTTTEDNEMHNSRARLMMTAGLAALGNLFAAAPFASTPSFTRSYGNNPKSLNGSYRLNSNAARQKREAVKRRNIAKHGGR